MNKYQVFLDMDGVVADFAGSVEKKFNLSPIRKWDFDECIPGMKKEEFWKTCNREFWANLEWCKDGKDILETVEQKFGKENICLLTSPSRSEGCLQGKMDWINKNLPEYKRRYLMGPAKHFAASSNKILIDDNDKNVLEFRMSGGHTILIPRIWNTLSYVCESKGNEFDIIYYLKQAFLTLQIVNNITIEK